MSMSSDQTPGQSDATAAGTPPNGDVPGNAQAANNGNSEDQSDGKAEDAKVFTKADIERIIKERLDRERAKAEREAEAIRRKTEEAALADQKRYEELAQKRQATIQDLEQRVKDGEEAAGLATRYHGALVKYRDALIAAVPERFQGPIKAMDIVNQIEWLAENMDQFATPAGIPGLPQLPNPANPNQSLTDEQRRARAFKVRL